jgi:hypothetical protein
MSTINIDAFQHSEYNTLLNNVSGSTVSKMFKRINPYQKGVLEEIELLDENYSDPRYTRPRYDGVKSTSAKYNFYTKGDTSYGKTAAVDFNTEKFAFANSINKKNLNFYDKTTVNIKYLIDESGSITELSRKNYHLFEVQNMYKKGDLVNVSLMDKLNPTNQASLDGDKLIWEGGFSYSPIIFREANENLVFTYNEPSYVTENRFGLKAINTSGYLFQTVGNTNAEFTTTPNGTTIKFLVDGISQTGITFSFSKIPSVNWPYTYSELSLGIYNSVTYIDYTNYPTNINYSNPFENGTSYYSIDWFIPGNTAELNGGYLTNDFTGKLTVVTSTENYSYVTAPRTTTYKVNVDIPIKFKAINPERANEDRDDLGPSIIKVVAILEVQKAGTSTWEYLDIGPQGGTRRDAVPYGYTKFSATNIPMGIGGSVSKDSTVAAVNENYSFIKMSGNTQATTYNGDSKSPFYEGRCQLFDKDISLNQNDKVRVKLYLAEITTFFRRNSDIYFEIQPGTTNQSYFEVWDKANANTTQVSSATITVDPNDPIFSKKFDNQTIVFNNAMSILWNNSVFEAPDSTAPNSISNSYSAIEYPFSIKVGDIIRFTQFNAIKPDYYRVIEVVEPKTQNSSIGTITTTSVLIKASIKLDRVYNPAQIITNSFAVLRKVEDETVIILDFKKKDGLSSNAFMIPYNIKPSIKTNVGNIVAPLKDTILSKVLIIG